MKQIIKKSWQQHPGKFILPILCLICFLLLPGCRQQEQEQPSAQKNSPTNYDGTIIAVGDSLTSGLGVAKNDAWPSLLQTRLLENGYNWQVINAGISGETSSGMLSRIQWINSRHPDIVILETGANDGFRGIPPAVISENIDKAVQKLQEKGVTVILAGMQMVRNLGEKYTSDFAEIYPGIAKERQILLIPFILKDVAGVNSLNQSDIIHPNEKGHIIIAETVFPYVVQTIQKRR